MQQKNGKAISFYLKRSENAVVLISVRVSFVLYGLYDEYVFISTFDEATQWLCIYHHCVVALG